MDSMGSKNHLGKGNVSLKTLCYTILDYHDYEINIIAVQR